MSRVARNATATSRRWNDCASAWPASTSRVARVAGRLHGRVAGRPRVIAPSEWLPRLLGDAWERTFADPQDVQQAMDTLMGRWNVLAAQLDAEALFDDARRLRLSPLHRRRRCRRGTRWRVAEGKLAPRRPPTAADRRAVGRWASWRPSRPLPTTGSSPSRDDERRLVRRLPAPRDRADAAAGELAAADLPLRYPGKTLEPRGPGGRRPASRCRTCAVLGRACAAPAPRRVEPKPGRNDPCPCGSGKKYKKCHGAGDRSTVAQP